MIKASFAVFAVGFCAFVVWLFQSAESQQRRAREKSEEVARRVKAEQAEFRPTRFRPALPAVIHPPVASATKISDLRDDDLVLGIEINGQSRAYPVNFISEPETEIINDVLGGVPIAVTWCSRCSNGVVFDRRVDGKPIALRVEGTLWRENMVMIDESGTLWSQLLGKAMQGPRSGRSLPPLATVLTDWKSWKRKNPSSTVLDVKRNSSTHFRSFLTARNDLYLSISDDVEPRAWKLAELGKHAVVNDWVRRGPKGSRKRVPVVVAFLPEDGTVVIRRRRLRGRVLTFDLNDRRDMIDRETGSVWNVLSGSAVSGPLAGSTLRLLPGTLVRGRAWRSFRSESSYWNATADVEPH